jgi:hypothetical protein
VTLFTISKTEGDIATIEFNPSLQPGRDRSLFDVVDHAEQADALARSGAEIASVILVADALEPDLWSDTSFAAWTAQVGACEARVEARRQLMETRIGPDHVDARALELGFPDQGSSESSDSDYRTQVFDAIIEEAELRALIDVLDKERDSCRFDWSDELDDEVELSTKEAAERWAVRLKELLAPQPLVKHRRRYNLPEPLAGDARSVVQQWYFVSDESGCRWWRGGSASSGARETHGRWAHTFAALASNHSVVCPTVVLRYDSRNVLQVVRESPTLLVDAMDLVGNYRIDYEASRTLVEPFVINAHALVRRDF